MSGPITPPQPLSTSTSRSGRCTRKVFTVTRGGTARKLAWCNAVASAGSTPTSQSNAPSN